MNASHRVDFSERKEPHILVAQGERAAKARANLGYDESGKWQTQSSAREKTPRRQVKSMMINAETCNGINAGNRTV